MKRTNKKGFTIVELVIVIAVIAILAAVLIPTFVNLTRKANESKDTQLVRNLNTALKADANGAKTMAEALEDAAAFGYDIAKINASATDNEILWDSVNNVFCYLKDGKVEYIPEAPGAKEAKNADLWVIANTPSAVYSTYLYGYTGTDAVVAKDGLSLDTSYCGAVDVTYTGAGAINLYTNGGTVTINNAAATVYHYGNADIVNIEKVASASYHAFGKIQSIVVKSGRVVVEETAKVAVIDASLATETVKIEAKKAEAITAVITNENEKVNVDKSAEAAVATKTAVKDLAELQTALDAGAKYIVLTADIEATSPVLIKNSVVLDGAEKKITTTGTNIGTMAGRGIRITASNINVTIKNLTVDASNAERAISVDSDTTGNTLHIDKCTLMAKTYAVNMQSYTSMEMLITNSKITGWAALNLWGVDNSVTVIGSTLTGNNNYETPSSNSFSVIRISTGEDGVTGEYSISRGISVEISDTTIEATAVPGECRQYYVGIDDDLVNSVVSFTNCTFSAEGDNAGGFKTGDTPIYVNGVLQKPVE